MCVCECVHNSNKRNLNNTTQHNTIQQYKTKQLNKYVVAVVYIEKMKKMKNSKIIPYRRRIRARKKISFNERQGNVLYSMPITIFVVVVAVVGFITCFSMRMN